MDFAIPVILSLVNFANKTIIVRIVFLITHFITIVVFLVIFILV
jgi:hypothetical protein